MSSPDEIHAWSEAMVDSIQELCQSTWETDAVLSPVQSEKFPKGTPGSYIALVGDLYNYEFGVAASWSDCEILSKRLLFMEDDEEIAEAEVADAMNEIANIVGGGVKRRMSDFDAGLKLGLPTFFEGPICPTSDQESSYAQVMVDGVDVFLVALKHKAAVRSASASER
jgi:hypothetical protein